MKKRFISIALVLSLMFLPVKGAHCTAVLRSNQQANAKTIARIAMKNWNKYGVLPSVAIAQAYIESGLGEHCPGNNLWGIASGAEHYASVEAGAIRYLKVINNGYYKGAPFCRDYHTQIRRILDGGYCTPVGPYYENVIWTIEHYHLDKYDKKLFRRLEEKKRKKKWKKTFTLKYDPDVDSADVWIDKSIVKKGTVGLIFEDEMLGLFNVNPGGKGYVIKVPFEKLDGLKVKLDVQENSKG